MRHDDFALTALGDTHGLIEFSTSGFEPAKLLSSTFISNAALCRGNRQ
jgi:hypothetical protein